MPILIYRPLLYCRLLLYQRLNTISMTETQNKLHTLNFLTHSCQLLQCADSVILH